MAKRTDIKKILIIGSGPIVIGQAAEFDYAGTQACLALKEEGYEVVLCNSNPATIMTDTIIADKVYMEPLTLEYIAKIIRYERPDAIIPGIGGQTGLNLAMQLEKKGILRECRVRLLGTSSESIERAEDRELFKELCQSIGEPVIPSEISYSLDEAKEAAKRIETLNQGALNSSELAGLVKTFVWIIRGTPLMLQIIVIYLGPGLLGMTNPWPSGSGGRMVAAVVAFAINYACYFSEIYRGGIESIPVGQYEAANVLGYTRAQTFLRIILPQVVKRIMPSITNEVVTLVKDTSMAFTVSYQEMFTIGKQIANSQTSFMPFLVAGVFYFVFNAIVDFVMGKIEKRMDYYK